MSYQGPSIKKIGLFIIFRHSLFTIHYFLAHNSLFIIKRAHFHFCGRERSGSVLDSRQRPPVRASPESLCCGPWARHIYPSLVLVQPRKTRPCLKDCWWDVKNQIKQKHYCVSGISLKHSPKEAFRKYISPIAELWKLNFRKIYPQSVIARLWEDISPRADFRKEFYR